MERLGGLVVGVLGVAAVTLHVVIGSPPLPLVAAHAGLWAVAVVVVAWMTRQLGIISGAVRRARAAIDLLDDAVVVVDASDHRVRYANLAAAALAELPVREVIGLKIWDTGPWPDLDGLLELVDEETETLTVEHRDARLQVAATRVVWEGERAYVVRARDVTDRDLAQRDLAERERRFRALAENVGGVVYRIRLVPELRVEYVSGRLKELVGHESAAWFVDPNFLRRIARPEHRPALDLTRPGHVYGEDGVHAFSIQHADGRWLQVEDHHTAEHDADGTLVAVQGIVFDATARWETEQALEEALRKQQVATETVQRTARVEQTLLQSVSHEIRTPMASALGFARMLRDQRDKLSPHQQDRLFERLVFNIERIEDLIGQMLEFDRYARGDAEITRTLERLDEVVDEVVARVDMEGRPLTTDIQLVMALMDRQRIGQSVEALLRNAVAHTPAGTPVRLTVTNEDDRARVVVEDDGYGVDSDIVAHVFEPFTQGAASHDAANPGVGLGLAMVRVSARLHGGDARHEPVLPHGARFIIEIPVVTAEPDTPASATTTARAPIASRGA